MVGSSREIWCSNRETRRFYEKLGDSRENRESWQVWYCIFSVLYFYIFFYKKNMYLPSGDLTYQYMIRDQNEISFERKIKCSYMTCMMFWYGLVVIISRLTVHCSSGKYLINKFAYTNLNLFYSF